MVGARPDILMKNIKHLTSGGIWASLDESIPSEGTTQMNIARKPVSITH